MKKKLIPVIEWWRGAIGGASYNSYLQGAIDYATLQGWTLPSAGTLTKLNDFATSASTNISEADVFYIMRMNDANLGNFARINWKNPGTNTITVVSGAVYGTGGYAGDATADYLNTNWQPANGVKYTLNDSAFIMSKTGTLTGGTKIPMGVIKTTATASRARVYYNAVFRGHINDVTEMSEAGSASETWLGMIRTSSTACGVIRGSSTSSETATSVQLTPLNFFLLAQNLDGSPSSYVSGNAEFFAAGSSAMMTGLKTKWDTYVASL